MVDKLLAILDKPEKILLLKDVRYVENSFKGQKAKSLKFS